ncbi:hypothetical protein A5766_04645 [Gordonia sp. 852002-51296_SCH5728562-b]|nr:hypothetical protein A5766_04645 [Gordonia sp. 852002-51296_SCH5728562-b]
MPEPLGNDRERHVSGQQQRRRTVAQIVHPNAPQADLVGEVVEQLRHVGGRDRASILTAEYQSVVAIQLAPLGTLDLLMRPVCEQRPHRHRIEFDGAVVPRRSLRRTELELPVLTSAEPALNSGPIDLDDLLADGDDPVGDVIPSETDSFAATQSSEREDFEQRTQAVRSRAIEERSEFRWRPGLHPRAGGTRQLHIGGGVETHQVLALRAREGTTQRGMNAALRSWRELLGVAPLTLTDLRPLGRFRWRLGDFTEHVLDVCSSEIPQSYIANRRHDVGVDMLLIATQRRRAHPSGFLCCEP